MGQVSQSISQAVVRFAGDSGDGMQLAGTHFTLTSAIFGNAVATLPDYPAEIRAPAGTVGGVSGFQVNFASHPLHSTGDAVDALFAMNPAALKAHLADVREGGTIVVNEQEFTKSNLKRANYETGSDPIAGLETAGYRVIAVPMNQLVAEGVKEFGLGTKDSTRCRNMFALGLAYWLYERPIDHTEETIFNYFGKLKGREDIANANIAVLKAGYNFGETIEATPVRYTVSAATDIPSGTYRSITGNEALALGVVAAGTQVSKRIVYGTYPITPASDILHNLAPLKHFDVVTYQAEDEIAAVCSAIGASFGGALGVTGTSGPGLALKMEAIGLAMMTELPLIVFNVQRGGPSTGLPTKTEQSDLLQAMYGRNGESPLVVLAPNSPSDCFDIAYQASKIALERRVPVIVLSDGYLANGAEPWLVPNPEQLTGIEVTHAPAPAEEETYLPYERDENLARPWAIPGQAELMHRIGGLEKDHLTGNVSYDPENHQHMTLLRAEKVQRVQDIAPKMHIYGELTGDVLVLGWGGPCGSIRTAVQQLQADGKSVTAASIRSLSPLPADLPELLKGFDKVLMPEINDGQLRRILRDKYLVNVLGLNKIQGKPFLVSEITQAVEALLNGTWPASQTSLHIKEGKLATASAILDTLLQKGG